MWQNKRAMQGVTLIALVITIIILLILAGVGIALLTGENGILKKAMTAQEKTKIAQYEEKLKLMGNELQLENVQNAISSEEYITQFEVKLKKDRDEKGLFQGSQINNDNNEKITVITKEGYVFEITKDGVKYLGEEKNLPAPDLQESDITVIQEPTTPTKGSVKVSISTKIEGYTLQYSTDNGINWINYEETLTIINNGVIQIRLTNGKNPGKHTTTNIVNIDRLKPNGFTPTVTYTSNSITLTGNTQDSKATLTDGCSGISKYYFSKNNGETWEPSEGKTEGSYTFSGLTEGKEYSLKMKAVDEAGNETITEEITQIASDYSEETGANAPKLVTGMTKIMFEVPTSSQKGKTIKEGETGFSSTNWYNYKTKQWANTQTQDGSMWVWIPRFAYKLNNSTQTVDVKFLIGTSNQYYDNNGKLQTARRVASKTEVADTQNYYYVHPAFTNESSINYANGGWDKELTGIWVAKFEAGYASGNNSATVKASSQTYTQNDVKVRLIEAGTSSDSTLKARNWLDGIYGSTSTKIKYPTFQGTTYSMNYINPNDTYNIAKVLNENGNIYGLNTTSCDSHLMKNSEWGAIAYLSKSQYGLNDTDIGINNINLNSGNRQRTATAGKSGVDSVYAVTGVTTGTADGEETIASIGNINNTNGNIKSTEGIYTWNQLTGQGASTTGNIYGIYDLNGGLWERTSSYVANGHSNLKTYGESITYNGNNLKTTSTKYTTVYLHNSAQDNAGLADTATNFNTASQANWKVNTKIFGDAIRETSTAGTGSTAWYNDFTAFPGLYGPFLIRGGYYLRGATSGLFAFGRPDGCSDYSSGFRAVLVAL